MAYGFATENHPKSQHWPKLVAAWFASVVLVGVLTACGAADEPEGAGQPAEQPAGRPAATGAKQVGLEGVTAYAGTGDPRFSGDGGPASEAGFFAPRGLALDAEGNLLISTDNRIRKIDSSTGVITTLAGTGRNRYSGDGGPAAEATLSEPTGIAVDGDGNIYVATHASGRIRKFEAATGVITTIAGGAIRGSIREESGDGGPATKANLREPTHVAIDAEGNVYAVAENRVRKIDATSGIITAFAGTGKRGLAGDDGPATEAELAEPSAIAFDFDGNLIVADTENHRVRMVDGATGFISTLAGIGRHMTCAAYDYGGPCAGQVDAGKEATGAGYSGDGGPATAAMLSLPSSVAVSPNGEVFITEGSLRVRKVDASTGIISTVVTSGAEATAISGQVRVHTGIFGELISIVVNNEGELFLADYKNNLVHKVASPLAAP